MNSRHIVLTFLFSVPFLFSCHKEREQDRYSVGAKDGLAVADIITYAYVNNGTIPADGLTTCDVTVKITQQADSQYRYVALKAGSGTFANGRATDTIFADANGYARTSLYSTLGMPCQLRASVRSYFVDTIIKFIPALPNEMLLVADSQNVDTSQPIKLTCILSRTSGNISSGLFVYYNIARADAATGDILVVPSYSRTHHDTADAVITNPFNAHGQFKVSACTVSDVGDTITRSLTIKVR